MPVIYPQPNHNARAIMAGAGMIRGALDERRRLQAELRAAAEKIRREDDRNRILDDRYDRNEARVIEDRAANQATLQADRGLARGMAGGASGNTTVPSPDGQQPQGPTLGGEPMGADPFIQGAQARKATLERLISDPNLSPKAIQLAVEDFKQNEQQLVQQEVGRRATDGLVKTRQMVIDSVRQGAIGEDEGTAEILASLNPQQYVKNDGTPDIQGMMQAVALVEPAMVAARQNLARQQTDDQTLAMFDAQFQTALQAAAPALEMGLYSQGEISQGLNEYNMLKLDWPQLDEQQRSARAKDLLGKLDFRKRATEAMEARDKKPKDHRSQMAERKAEDLFLRGMEEPGEYDELTKTTGPSTRKTFTYDEALAEAQRLTQAPPPAMPSRQSVLAPGQQQIAPGVSGQVPMGVPQSQPMAPAAAPRGTGSVDQVSDPGAAVRPDPGTIWPSEAPAQPRSAAVQGVKPQAGKRRSRTEILGGDKGPEQDPAPLREAVAKAIALGIPLDQFQDIYGIDLNTLTEEDLREIEAMTGKKRKPAGKKKP